MVSETSYNDGDDRGLAAVAVRSPIVPIVLKLLVGPGLTTVVLGVYGQQSQEEVALTPGDEDGVLLADRGLQP